nr:site-specific integrase [Caldilineaceae bacterium]
MIPQPTTQLAVIDPINPSPTVGEAGWGSLAAIWQVSPDRQERAMLGLWYRLRDQWLHIQESDATRRAYATASMMWLDWLADRDVQPWAVTTSHVRAWQDWLTESGNAPATVNARLSAVSSWYQFVINEVHIVDGVERSAFFDANGATRANPFKIGNLKRPKVTQYGKAAPLHAHTVQKLFDHLRAHADTLTGSRNYALILTHLLTASRGSEIVRLTWGDIRPNRNQPGSYVFAWSGKGDKAETSPFPADAYHAIVAHLKIAGRWLPGHPDHISDDDYIF